MFQLESVFMQSGVLILMCPHLVYIHTPPMQVTGSVPVFPHHEVSHGFKSPPIVMADIASSRVLTKEEAKKKTLEIELKVSLRKCAMCTVCMYSFNCTYFTVSKKSMSRIFFVFSASILEH